MISEVALRAFRAAAGEAAVLEHDPIALDGVKLGLTLAPEDERSLAALLEACTAHDVPVIVRGGGTQIGLGNRPDATASAWLSTAALAGGCRVEAEEGVAWVGAGTPVGELEDAARAAGWLAPLESVGPTATVGGALATARVTPRSLGLGRPRDVVLGLDVALASGELTHCGARVVKNVSGYDLVKLQIGAFGTLGVLTGAWLRLRPKPEAVAAFFAQGGDLDRLALETARAPGARAAVLLDEATSVRLGGPEGGPALLAEFAGDGPVVADGEAALRAVADVSAAPEAAVDRLRTLDVGPELGELVFRIDAPASALADVCNRLHALGARTIRQPGLSRITVGWPMAADDESAVDEACRAVRAALPGESSHAILARAPAWAKENRDVFGARAETLPLMRALKREFDPARILNPGRFVGGL